MDVKTLKHAYGVGLLAFAAVATQEVHAAQGNVTVDVNLPTVLVMYYYSDIDLDLDAAGLVTYLSPGGIACGGDWCDAQPNPGTVNVATINATTPVTFPALNDPYVSPGATTFLLQDVVGVRALGCPTGIYQATFDVTGDNGVTPDTNVPVANIDGADCTLSMTTGDLSFDLDFDAMDPGDSTASATLDVTINGI